jgi:hypothetical protein
VPASAAGGARDPAPRPGKRPLAPSSSGPLLRDKKKKKNKKNFSTRKGLVVLLDASRATRHAAADAEMPREVVEVQAGTDGGLSKVIIVRPIHPSARRDEGHTERLSSADIEPLARGFAALWHKYKDGHDTMMYEALIMAIKQQACVRTPLSPPLPLLQPREQTTTARRRRLWSRARRCFANRFRLRSPCRSS